jgi:uncharacterized membrane protein
MGTLRVDPSLVFGNQYGGGQYGGGQYGGGGFWGPNPQNPAYATGTGTNTTTGEPMAVGLNLILETDMADNLVGAQAQVRLNTGRTVTVNINPYWIQYIQIVQ